MTHTLLDTDILSMLMRMHPVVTNRAAAYVAAHSRLTLSVIAQYEILKGLKARGADAQSAAFDQFCLGCEIVGLDDASVREASRSIRRGRRWPQRAATAPCACGMFQSRRKAAPASRLAPGRSR